MNARHIVATVILAGSVMILPNVAHAEPPECYTVPQVEGCLSQDAYGYIVYLEADRQTFKDEYMALSLQSGVTIAGLRSDLREAHEETAAALNRVERLRVRVAKLRATVAHLRDVRWG